MNRQPGQHAEIAEAAGGHGYHPVAVQQGVPPAAIFTDLDPDARIKVGALYDRIGTLCTELGECFGELGILQKGLAECRPKSVMDAALSDQPATSTMQRQRELLTANDIAKLVRCDAKTIRNWRSQGMLPPAITFGSLIRWRASDIDAWIEERMEGRS